MTAPALVPFSRCVEPEQVHCERQLRLEATNDERRAVAAQLGLRTVDRLEARLGLRPWRRHGLRVEGFLEATIGQNCSVSMVPIVTEISETFLERLYPEDRERRRRNVEEVIDIEATDDYATYSGDAVDLGALVVEYLTLAIDPYPKRSGAVLTPVPDKQDDGQPPSPFAGLAEQLKAGETSSPPDPAQPRGSNGKSSRRNDAGKS